MRHTTRSNPHHWLAVVLALLLLGLVAVACDDESGGDTMSGDTANGDQTGGDGTVDPGDGSTDAIEDFLDGVDGTGGDGTSGDGTSGDAVGDGGGDGGDTDDDTTEIPGLTALEVAPLDQVLTVAPAGAAETVQFMATGTFDDGSSRDVTTEVEWFTSSGFIGSIDTATGLFTTSNAAGGSTQIIARSGAVEAATTLTVLLEGSIDADDAGMLPGNVADLFDPASNTIDDAPSEQRPAIVYPSHETMFPRNIYLIDFQWDPGQGNDIWRLSFESATTQLAIYTDQEHWLANETVWRWLAHSNAGQAVSVQLQAVDSTNPGTIYASDSITIYFSASEVLGAIYYWSTGTSAVMKGVPSSPTPTQFWATEEDGTCVACHTVSRNGQRLLVGYGGEKLQSLTIPDRVIKVPEDRYNMGFGTYSPDASKIVFADGGELFLIDGETGDPIGPDAGRIDLGEIQANHPDWSPSGEYVAFAGGPKASNKAVEGASIYRVAYDATTGAWGTPELLLASTGADDDNNFFPSYSPDSSYIAYAHANGKSKDAPTATVRIISADGTQGPVELARLNTRVRQSDGIMGIGNSMPTWAPTTTPGISWLAFSSLRAYGNVLDGGRDQLWIAAIEPGIFSGNDPSYAAFWAPFQDVEESNHRAFWAFDTDQPCVATDEVCDNLDNNCNGVVDENCIACGEVEICGDGLDNECNGVIDDGCFLCGDTEICDDNIDNDCNGQIDEGCSLCSGIEICGDGLDNDCDNEVDEGCFECGDEELCFDMIDNDCDGDIDEGCDDCEVEEICFDNIDNDCNGVIDDGCVIN